MNLALLRDLPTLETVRLTLRALTFDDTADVYEYARDPKVARLASFEAHESLQATVNFLTQAIKPPAAGFPIVWGLYHRADKKIIGTIAFGTIDEKDFRAEIGYAMAYTYWNQGYMTEAAGALITFGFAQMGLNRIEAMCEPANVGSARVMEKVGMQCEGILRQYVFAKGNWRDMKIYSVLKSEWERSNASGSKA